MWGGARCTAELHHLSDPSINMQQERRGNARSRTPTPDVDTGSVTIQSDRRWNSQYTHTLSDLCLLSAQCQMGVKMKWVTSFPLICLHVWSLHFVFGLSTWKCWIMTARMSRFSALRRSQRTLHTSFLSANWKSPSKKKIPNKFGYICIISQPNQCNSWVIVVSRALCNV